MVDTYLPKEIEGARVLILVKTYPIPNSNFGETVCTAGLLDGEKWVRVYPISWRVLKDDQKYPKYSWIKLDLVRHPTDFRRETYKPRKGFEEAIAVVGELGSKDAWAARKQFVLREVFTSMKELIAQAKSESVTSLATFKPAEILDFTVEEDPDRDWKRTWLAKSMQASMFDLDENGLVVQQRLVKKLPYRFRYKFRAQDDDRPRELLIQDWELGALFWNCLKRADGDETIAMQQVKQKYFDEFVGQKDLYLFLGTDYKYHKRNSPDPFLIIGVFYPPKSSQLSLF